MPVTFPQKLITTRTVKRIEPTEVTSRNKVYRLLPETDRSAELPVAELTVAERKLLAHFLSREWHAAFPRQNMATAIYAAGSAGATVPRALTAPTDFVRRRVLAQEQAKTFVAETAKAYAEGYGAQALQKAINVLLNLVDRREYAVIDSIFESLSARITETAQIGTGSESFPREGSFWIACLTLTKGARKHLDLRTAFINLLRDYSRSILEPRVAERLLRNVD